MLQDIIKPLSAIPILADIFLSVFLKWGFTLRYLLGASFFKSITTATTSGFFFGRPILASFSYSGCPKCPKKDLIVKGSWAKRKDIAFPSFFH